MQPRTAYTGRPRERKTRPVGPHRGDGSPLAHHRRRRRATILAVVTVFALLLYVVFPLFQSASVLHEDRVTRPSVRRRRSASASTRIGSLVWGLFADGRIDVVELATGKVIAQKKVFDGAPLQCSGRSMPGTESAIFGFEDGSLRTGEIGFRSRRRIDLSTHRPRRRI